MVERTVPHPTIAETYYATCAAIDKHNRCRQDDLAMEKKIETKEWSKRVNMSIFAMCVVDTWLVYNGCKQSDDAAQMNEQQAHSTQKEFYTLLAEELIDNSYDEVRRRRQRC